MGFLTKEGLQNLTNKLVQGDAIKVASHRGKNVKEVIDNIQRECESVALPNTMTLENRVSEFKVGKGRDVDVSEDVEEGKIEVELEGKTYQNLAYSTQYLFNTNRLECFTVERDKNNNHVRVVAKEDVTSGYMYFNCGQVSKILIKPNTTYTAIIKKNPTVTNMRLMLSNGDALNISAEFSVFDSLGRCKFVTNDMEDSTRNIIYINNKYSIKKGDAFEIEDLIILEGDHTQTPLEELPKYFEGIKSSFEDGVVDVEVQGKNLFDGQLRTFNTNDTYIDNIGQHHNGDNNIPIKPNTSYTMTFETISGDSNIYIWNGNEKVLTIPSGKDTVSFRTPLECNSLSFYRSVADYTKDRLKYKIQLEENSKSTSYEPYYKKKISFNIGEPLRSLPNGVCDEITRDGKLIKRIGKIVLDGNEKEIWLNNIRDGRTQFVLHNTLLTNPSISIYQNGNAWCDTLPVIPNDNPIRAIWVYEKNNIVIQLPVEIADTIDKLRTWLSQNPTTVYYELETPTITPIEPIEFNISQGAVININSNISPASTHKVILNRAGQIEQGIQLIADLKSRINNLERLYDSNLITTQYRIDNLKLNYELEREED